MAQSLYFRTTSLTAAFCALILCTANPANAGGLTGTKTSARENSTNTIKRSVETRKGDKAFGELNFAQAIVHYKNALPHETDTLYLLERIAYGYREMNDIQNATEWYARLADNPSAGAIDKYYYADLLHRQGRNYLAKKYYQAYANTSAPNKPGEIPGDEDKTRNIPKNNIAYKIDPVNFNTPKSEFAPAYYKDGKLIFTSNRSDKQAAYDKWTMDKGCKIYVVALDSTVATEEIKLKVKGKAFSSTATYNNSDGKLIFAAGGFGKKNTVVKNGQFLPFTGLYSGILSKNKGKDIAPLSLNNNLYSVGHPSISRDGKSLYFASDKPGGHGGTDIYSCTLNSDGSWSEPVNLGKEVNTAFDEKFPFIADDGTLYFASNAPGGVGGLDIYKTRLVDGKWTRPENLGMPVNSKDDDFSFIIDAAGKSGYFASNRAGGLGEDDIYHFTYDETRLNYQVTVKVVDSRTNEPLKNATLALDCRMPISENALTNASGEMTFSISGGKNCTIVALKPDYKEKSADISMKDKNNTITIALKPDIFALKLTVKEDSTQLPLKDVIVSITRAADSAATNFATNEFGKIETNLHAGNYKITFPGFPAMKEQFSTSEADTSTGIINKTVRISRDKMEVKVPLYANCFSTMVKITDLATGIKTEVRPSDNGEIRLDLKTNGIYLVEHDGKKDTISTKGLVPGKEIEGPCKFQVGQTWIMPNIYYDLNKWNIRKDAAAELDKLVKIMKENPTLQIELSSHTDCRSSARYNLMLSARRAKSAVDYMVKKGIKGSRIIAMGYGESRIINGCNCEPSNDSPCDEKQHQANRRTEIKVLNY
jgi:outer membrane protein OmpA-like peptidoglycan-associated protein